MKGKRKKVSSPEEATTTSGGSLPLTTRARMGRRRNPLSEFAVQRQGQEWVAGETHYC
ncbi:hypothetical protein A2U01_0076021 [Trifolium medium]|uniref:Uncharacterized protein n=1 Tax=Trifolium medium TaxID=97028 RepID=A0A392T0U0_9FABA|nr:hypothetical protein [Trifolium medium]